MFVIIIMGIFLSLNTALATTRIEDKISSLPKLISPIRLTAGPEDNYQSQKISNKTLLFVEKPNLIPRILQLDLSTGNKIPLFKTDADQPCLSPSKKQLVFRSFASSALGEIWVYNFQTQKTQVLNLPALEKEKSSPFWISETEIGFQSGASENAQIIGFDLLTNTSRVLANGEGPAARGDGRWLAYNRGNGRQLVVKDLAQDKAFGLDFDIPGMTGFSVFAPEGLQLYFTRYFNDTNGDGQIDGHDHSLIFKVDLNKIESGNFSITPITSLDQNCSFPNLDGDKLYVTCDYEGSLDIYELEPTGVIPKNWRQEQLWDFHRSARSYEERILILQAMLHNPLLSPDTPKFELWHKILSDHFFLEDWTSVNFYWQKIRSKYTKKTQNKFDRFLKNQKIEKVDQLENPLSVLMHDWALDKQWRKKEIALPEYFSQSIKTLVTPLTSQDYKITRTFHLLRASEAEPNPLRRKELVQRLNQPELRPPNKQQSKQPTQPLIQQQLQPLIQTELDSLEITTETNPAIKKEKINHILENLLKLKNNYLLFRAASMRAILILSKSQDFKYVQDVGGQFLKHTSRQSAEYWLTREFLTTVIFDRGYEAWQKNNPLVAMGHFYGSILLVDDLEGHAGFIETSMASADKDKLPSRYEDLKSKNILDESLEFVDLYLHEYSNKYSNAYPRHSLAAQAKNDKQERGYRTRFLHPSYYLLLGSIQMKKILQSPEVMSSADFLAADQTLNMALDLARDNPRLRVAALDHLSFLHGRSGNWGAVVKYQTARQKYGFLLPAEEIQSRWLKAKALYFTNSYDLAADELGLLSNPSPKILERMAFYQLNAKQWDNARQTYEKFFKNLDFPLNSNDEAKIRTSYALSLLRSPPPNLNGVDLSNFNSINQTQANAELTAALALQNTDQNKNKNQNQNAGQNSTPNSFQNSNPSSNQSSTQNSPPISSQNSRLRLNILGLLAQISPHPTEYLRERIDMLNKKDDKIKNEDRLDYLLRAQCQLWALQPNAVLATDYLKALMEYLEEDLPPLSQTALNSLRCLLENLDWQWTDTNKTHFNTILEKMNKSKADTIDLPAPVQSVLNRIHELRIRSID